MGNLQRVVGVKWSENRYEKFRLAQGNQMECMYMILTLVTDEVGFDDGREELSW